jgi:hypothetical protein
MEPFLYRFRTCEKLLGSKYQELERQEIYFADPQELNDPIEGFKDIFWFGDEIVWINLLKHYILCLHVACDMVMFSPEDTPFDRNQIPINITENDLPQPARVKYQEICKLFFEQEPISQMSKLLAARSKPVRRNELSFYLRYIHSHALHVIFSEYKAHKIRPFPDDLQFDQLFAVENYNAVISEINELEREHSNKPDVTEQWFAMSSRATEQLLLINKYNNPAVNLYRNKLMVFTEYPSIYMQNIDRTMYGKWYAACFVKDCRNPTVWSHYGDAHKGICLKFRTNALNDLPIIQLHGIVGIKSQSGKSDLTYGDKTLQFSKVHYTKRYPEIDFFTSLGQVRDRDINQFWYADVNGNMSERMKDIFTDRDKWHKTYWERFYEIISTKLDTWAYENEYRLIITELMIDYDTPVKRKLKYKFADLEGIIFGMNTLEEDKLLVFKIIESKCRLEARSDLKFYQAFYAKEAGEIQTAEMTFVKFT